MLVGLRNAGEQFHDIIDRKPPFHGVPWDQRPFKPDELTGQDRGAHRLRIIGRRLLELLEPFHTTIYVYDPYVPRELADVYDITFTSLDNVLSLSDVVVCLAPITPATRGMLGPREFALLRDGSVFVNVSRGAIVQTDALIDRLRDGTVVAALDVFDPEPIPEDRDPGYAQRLPHAAHGLRDRGDPVAQLPDHGRRAREVLRRARDSLRPAPPDDRQPDGPGAADRASAAGPHVSRREPDGPRPKCSGSEVRARIRGPHAAAPTRGECSSLTSSRRRSARVNCHSNGVASCS